VEFSTENYSPTVLHQGFYGRRFLSFSGDSKSPAPIRADEYFWPMPVIKGVMLVLTNESGLICCPWLLRKLIITVTGAKLLHVHSVSPFSRQTIDPC
jgi:hypothetical protein